RDAPGGSAVGGRKATFALGFIATNPDQFEHEATAAEVRFRTAVESFSADEHGANFLGHVRSAEHFASGWSPATFARLAEVSARYDPERVFNAGFA
ncbi:MAG TPA: hypothetical protein VFU02_13980, partial [Polyangiaceae bacterium]|nr:hypothetical protein [Polyangiaceae bacterium]